MSAYNWIIVEGRCPTCGTETTMRAQTHVASSYDGDASGRFHESEYRVGQAMRWWKRDDPRFQEWPADRELSRPEANDEREEEACYATCSNCNASLCVVLRFHENLAEAVVSISTEENWPAGYPK